LTFYIEPAPSYTSYTYYNKGYLYVNSGTSHVEIQPTTGPYYIYFTQDNILTAVTFSDLSNATPVAIILYFADKAEGALLDERHGMVMDWMTHEYLHHVNGTQIFHKTDFGISDYSFQPTNPTNANNQPHISGGTIADEDLIQDVTELNSGGPYVILYQSGSTGNWTFFRSDMPFMYDDYIQYNDFNNPTWQLTELTSGKYVNAYICATNAYPHTTSDFRYVTFLGQTEFSTLSDAESYTISNLNLTGLPFSEIAPLYKLTFYSFSGFTNSGHCRLETDVVSLIGYKINQSSFKHNLLSNRNDDGAHESTAISVDTENFTDILSTNDDTVQKALVTIDSHSHDLNNLQDVIVTNPQDGQILLYSGSYWYNFDNSSEFGSAGFRINEIDIDNGDGSITLPYTEVVLNQESDGSGLLTKYMLASGITGIDYPALPNGLSYVVGDYNSGSPTYTITTDATIINEQNIVPFVSVYRTGIYLHILEWNGLADGLVNKLNERFIKTDRFHRESGFELGTSGNTGDSTHGDAITCTEGIMWYGGIRRTQPEYNTASATTLFLCYPSGTTTNWIIDVSTSGFNNTNYSDYTGSISGLTLPPLSAGSYNVNWVYAGIEDLSHLYYIIGTGEYPSIADAQNERIPTVLPDLISFHTMFVGRIIGKQGTSMAQLVTSAFDVTVATTVTTSHNLLTGLNGGTANQYYHLTNSQHSILTDGSDASSLHNHDTQYSGWISAVTLGAANALTAHTDLINPHGTYFSALTYTAHTHVWSNDIISKPTTISGYGITDAYTKTETDVNFVSATTFANHVQNFNSHTADTSNPHNVTAAQISAYTYIQANANFVSAITFASHTADTSNPHNVTAAQISAYTYTQSDNTFATIINLNSHTADTSIHFTKNSITLDNLGDVNTAGTSQGYYLVYSAGTWVGLPDSSDFSPYWTSSQTNTQINSAVSYHTSLVNPHGTSFSALTYTAHTHLWSDLATTAHTHDDRYYTETEIDTILTGYTQKNFLIDVSAVTSYTATTFDSFAVYDELGDVNIYIPDSNSSVTNKIIRIYKYTDEPNEVIISTIGGQLIDNFSEQKISKNGQGITLISHGTHWGMANTTRTTPSVIYVHVNSDEFRDISSAVIWANANVVSPTIISVAAGTYYIDDTITINNSNIVGIEGDGYFETTIHPTINLTGKTMFHIQSASLLKNLFIDGSNLGTTGNSYYGTSGSIAVEYDNTTRIFFDSLRINYAYTMFHVPQRTETFKLNDCVFLYSSGDTIILDNGACGVMVGCSIRYCESSAIRLLNSTSATPPTKMLAQATRVYGSSTRYNNKVLTTEGSSEAYFSDFYVQYSSSGFEAHDTSKIQLSASIVLDVTEYCFNQVDSTASIRLNLVESLYYPNKFNITNSELISIIGIDVDDYYMYVGNGSDSNNTIFKLNIGQEEDNPSIDYGLWGGSKGLFFNNTDTTSVQPSFFASTAINRNSQLITATYGTGAESMYQSFNLISYATTYNPLITDWDKVKMWSFMKNKNGLNDLYLDYYIGQTGQTTYIFTSGGSFHTTNLYISGLTVANNGNILTWDSNYKVIDSGTKISDILYSAHTHTNKANLDVINQNLSTTDDVTFDSANLKSSYLYLGEGITGITLKSHTSSGSTLSIRNAADNNYGNLVVNDLVVLGTQTVNQSATIDTTGNTITMLKGQTTPIQNAYITVERYSGDTSQDAVVMWDEGNQVWKAGFYGNEVKLALDTEVVHTTGDEYISGNKTFNNKVIFGTGLTNAAQFQFNKISNLQSNAICEGADVAFFASTSGRTYFLGNTAASVSLGRIDGSGNPVDYWSIFNSGNTNFELKYGSNYETHNHPTVLSLTNTGNLTVTGVTTYSVEPVSDVLYFSDKTVRIDKTHGSVNINSDTHHDYPIFADNKQITASGIIQTPTTASTTAISPTSAFTHIESDARIVANGQTRYVVRKYNDAEILLDEEVDWNAGYDYVYKNASYIFANGSSADVKGFYISEDETNRWELYQWHDEDGEFLNIWSESSKHDTFIISRTGRFGINPPLIYTNQKQPPDVVSIFPQGFDMVLYYDGASYTDNTIIAGQTSQASFIFLTGTTDYTYVGKYCPFDSILLYTENELTGTSLKFEYWNGSIWITMSNTTHDLVDGSNNLTKPGAVLYTKSKLTNWTTTSINDSDELYYIRISATAITEPSYMFILTNNGINRLGVYCANGDTTPFFQVDYFGRTALGNSLSATRLASGTPGDIGRSLAIIDDEASMRVWQYTSVGTANDPMIEFIKGNSDTITNNLRWDLRLENSDTRYNQNGLVLRDTNLDLDKMILGGTLTGTSSLILPLKVSTNNQTKNGILLDLYDISEDGTNTFNFIDIIKSTTATTTLNGINICSGLTNGIYSQSKVFINHINDSFALDVSGSTRMLNVTATTFYGSLDWNYLYNKPTTVSGYGIADVYTKTQSDSNYLSANTSYYTQSQANDNFLSANTSYYTQAQANANFLSASTTANQLSAYTYTQANANFLSANTSYYTQSQANANFLSATTTAAYFSVYTYNQANANFLSASTTANQLSAYTYSQANANFLSANTSYYTQSQANANFVSATTFIDHTSATNPHNTTLQSLSGVTITTPVIYQALVYNGDGFWVNSAITATVSSVDWSIITNKPTTLSGYSITDAISISGGTIYGTLGINVVSRTAQLHINSGSTAANSAPIKLTPGTLMTNAEIGAIEYDGLRFYYTDNSGIGYRQELTPIAYGSMYEVNTAGGAVIAVSNLGYTGWVNATSNVNRYTTFTNNVTADRITIDSGGDGTYEIVVTMSSSCSNTTPRYIMAVYRNGAVVPNLLTRWSITNTSEIRNISLAGQVSGVNGGDYFDLRFSSNNATSRNITPYSIWFNVKRIDR